MATTPKTLKAFDATINMLKERVKSPDTTPEFKVEAKKRIARYEAQRAKLHSDAMKEYNSRLRRGRIREGDTETYELGQKIKNKTVSYEDIGKRTPGAMKRGLDAFEETFGGDNLLTTVKAAMAITILDVLGADTLIVSAVTGLAESGALANIIPALIGFATANPIAAVCLVAVAYLGAKKLFGPMIKRLQAKLDLKSELSTMDLESGEGEFGEAPASFEDSLTEFETRSGIAPKKDKEEGDGKGKGDDDGTGKGDDDDLSVFEEDEEDKGDGSGDSGSDDTKPPKDEKPAEKLTRLEIEIKAKGEARLKATFADLKAGKDEEKAKEKFDRAKAHSSDPRHRTDPKALADLAAAEEAYNKAVEAHKKTSEKLADANKDFGDAISEYIAVYNDEYKRIHGVALSTTEKKEIAMKFTREATPTRDIIKGWFKDAKGLTESVLTTIVGGMKTLIAKHEAASSFRFRLGDTPRDAIEEMICSHHGIEEADIASFGGLSAEERSAYNTKTATTTEFQVKTITESVALKDKLVSTDKKTRLEAHKEAIKQLQAKKSELEGEQKELQKAVDKAQKAYEKALYNAELNKTDAGISEADRNEILKTASALEQAKADLAPITTSISNIKTKITALEKDQRKIEEALGTITSNGKENKKKYEKSPDKKIIAILDRRAGTDALKDKEEYKALKKYCALLSSEAPDAIELATVETKVKGFLGKYTAEEKSAIEALIESRKEKSFAPEKPDGFDTKTPTDRATWYIGQIKALQNTLKADPYNKEESVLKAEQKVYTRILEANGYEVGSSEFEDSEKDELTAATQVLTNNTNQDDRKAIKAEIIKLYKELISAESGKVWLSIAEGTRKSLTSIYESITNPTGHKVKNAITSSKTEVEKISEVDGDGKVKDTTSAGAYNSFMSSFNEMLDNLLNGKVSDKVGGKKELYSVKLKSKLSDGKIPDLCRDNPNLKKLFDTLIEAIEELEKVAKKYKDRDETERKNAVAKEAKKLGLKNDAGELTIDVKIEDKPERS